MSEDFPITIYHHSACGTARNTLGIIEAAGYPPWLLELCRPSGVVLSLLHRQPESFVKEDGQVVMRRPG